MTILSLRPVSIPVDVGRVDGMLALPGNATGLVLFAHQHGGNTQSPRNKQVSSTLHQRGFATLIFDLLTPVEDSRHKNRFNVDLLTERLKLATKWVHEQEDLADIPFGYLGASIGAAAALRAASCLGKQVGAIVSLGGRPDLAGKSALGQISSPSLLLVGGRDTSAIALNREALENMNCVKQMRVIPGATQQFEQSKALKQATDQTTDWFSKFLGSAVLTPK